MGLGYCTMKQDYITNRIYKKLQYPVLGRSIPNQAGCFNLKITTRKEVIDLLLFTYQGGQAPDYPSTLFEVVKISGLRTDNRMICNGFELVTNNLVNEDDQDCSVMGSPFLFTEIKGRVERDCLNVSQNKTEDQNNMYSAKAGLPAPTSEDTCYVLRVRKETGIEKSVDAQKTKDALESYCLSSKMTLKSDLYRLFHLSQV